METFDHIAEYLLVTEPDATVSKFMVLTKQFFESEYGCSHSSSSKPHITIAHFAILTPNESRLLKYLKLITSTTKPPEVTVSGFSHFKNHAIYLNLANPKSLTDLATRIEKTCKRCTIRHIKSIAPSFATNTPHLTIARAMTEDQFAKAWQHWQGKSYEASFEANELILLKRRLRLDKAEPFSVKDTLPFTGNSDLPIQTSLPF